MIRVPKTIYLDEFIVGFHVKNKQLFYDVMKWERGGTVLALLSSGKYNNEDPKSLITSIIKCEDSLK